MGCFACLGGKQAVDDEPRPQAEEEQQKGSIKESIPVPVQVDDYRPSTAPPAHAQEKRAGGSPVPSTSSLDWNAPRDIAALNLQKGGSPHDFQQFWGSSPGKQGSNPLSWAAGRRASAAQAGSDHGSLVSQDSVASTTSMQPKSLRDPEQLRYHHDKGEMGSLSAGDEERPQSRSSSAQRAATAAAAAAALGEEGMGKALQQQQQQDPQSHPSGGSGAIRDHSGAPIAATTFTFKELERATRGFAQHNFVGEGGFGRVYKGKLESTGQIVAVKQLDRNGLQGNREFLVEVLMLSLLHHPNLVQLIGYCADGDQRLLVYEFMANGALEDHLHDLPEGKESLDWNMRMKVAAGAARGLEYLHDKASPPVIYRDFKSSNILLDENWHPKLSDFGLAKLGPVGDKTHVSTRVMGTYGYCAPEYAMTGQLTVKSDVYSFGVVLLELITGRKAIDNTRPPGEHNLVAWARPLFKDRRKFPAMADPLLHGKYPMRGLYQALAVAAMCLQEQASQRPMIHDVVTALSYLAAQHYDPNAPPPQRFSPGTPNHDVARERRGSRSPQVRGLSAASPRASPGHHGTALRRGGSPNSPGLGPLGATSSARGYRESPGRSGLGSGRSTPNHPRPNVHHQTQHNGSENGKPVQQAQQVQE